MSEYTEITEVCKNRGDSRHHSIIQKFALGAQIPIVKVAIAAKKCKNLQPELWLTGHHSILIM